MSPRANYLANLERIVSRMTTVAVVACVVSLCAPVTSALIAQQSTPSASDTTHVSVTGVAYDSITQAPLANAIVQMVSLTNNALTFAARTDAAGAFRIPLVKRGRYLIGFLHPTLDSLGLSTPQWALAVGDSGAHAVLTTPSPRTLRARICKSAPGDSTGFLLGLVHDADSDMPVPGASIFVSWNTIVVGPKELASKRRDIAATTDPNGWFAICGLPYDVAMTAQAESPTQRSGGVELTVPALGLTHLDFAVASDSAAVAVVDTSAPRGSEPLRKGNAQLSGVVLTPDHRVAGGVQIVVWGTAASTVTSDSGTFALAGLPAGTYTLEARAVGYAPTRTSVNLASRQMRTISVVLAQKVPVLEEVTVYGKKRNLSTQIAGFMKRSHGGTGHFITQDEIRKKRPYRITDLLRTVPGVRVIPTGAIGYTVAMRGFLSRTENNFNPLCDPALYVDGLKQSGGTTTSSPATGASSFDPDQDVDAAAIPQDIFGIEVYTSASELPPEYRNGNNCGAILIWTRPRTSTSGR